MSLGLHNHGHVRERGREEKEEDFSPVIAKFTTTAAFSHPFSCPHVPEWKYEVQYRLGVMAHTRKTALLVAEMSSSYKHTNTESVVLSWLSL